MEVPPMLFLSLSSPMHYIQRAGAQAPASIAGPGSRGLGRVGWVGAEVAGADSSPGCGPGEARGAAQEVPSRRRGPGDKDTLFVA